MDKAEKQFSYFILFFIVLIAFGVGVRSCARPSTGKKPPTQPAALEPASIVESIPVGAVQLFDGTIRRESAIPMSGDRRPLWLVEGRIYNTSARDITHLSLRVIMTDTKQSQIDGTTIDLKINIPAGEVRGFSQEIQFLPPAHGADWNWDWQVVTVDAKNPF